MKKLHLCYRKELFQLNFFCKVLILLCITFGASTLHAKSGLQVIEQSPHANDRIYRDRFVDMQVNVLGHELRVLRTWDGSKWQWNKHWQDLEFLNGAGEEWDPAADNIANLKYIKRSGVVYVLMEGSNPRIFFNTLSRTIEVSEPVAGQYQYTWKDREGSRMIFNHQGRLKSYANNNGVNAYITYSADKLATIKDHFHNIAITFNYTGNDVSSLVDYSGRTVSYNYESGNLKTVTFVDAHEAESGLPAEALDETLTYNYNSDGFTYTDANGRITTIKMDGRGYLASRFNHDGVGSRYEYLYDSDNELTTVTSIDGEGVVTESVFNISAQEVKHSINGEIVKTVDMALSDKGKTISRFTDNYKVRPNSFKPLDLSLYIKYNTVIDAFGRKTDVEYDQWGNAVKILHEDGTYRLMKYSLQYNKPIEIINEKGVITLFEYDVNGNLLTQKDGASADGSTWQRISCYEYNEYGLRKKSTIAPANTACSSGISWQYEYDVDSDASGSVCSGICYGNQVKVIDPLLHETEYLNYDAMGLAHTMIDQLNETWSRNIDNSGNIIQGWNIGGLGDKNVYDVTGQLVKTILTYGDGSNTINDLVFTNTHNGQVLTATETKHPDNPVSILAYDKLNRLVQVTDAGTSPSSFSVQTYEYNAKGQPTRSIDGEGNVTLYEYVNNQLTKIQYPIVADSKTTLEERSYDERGRLSTVTIKDSGDIVLASESYTYDALDNVLTITDAEHNVTRYEYDDLNRRNKIYYAGITAPVILQYDERDNLIQVTDPEGRSTYYEYTDRNKLENIYRHSQYSGGNKTRYVYDANGNLTEVYSQGGEKVVTNYDSRNRIDTVQYYAHFDDVSPVRTIDHGFDNYNRYTGYIDNFDSSSLTYTYNDLSQITDVSVNFGTGSAMTEAKTYSYTYYPNRLKASFTPPQDADANGSHPYRQYNYFYNKNNQMASLGIAKEQGGQAVDEGNINYSRFNWFVAQDMQFPGNTWLKQNVDALLRRDNWSMLAGGVSAIATADYSYNSRLQLTGIVTNHGVYDYSYDQIDRLTEWSRSDSPNPIFDRLESFAYDDAGNREAHYGNGARPTDRDPWVTDTFSYNNDNQLEGNTPGFGDLAFTYNANGHTATRTVTGLGVYEYTYNEMERLSKVEFTPEGMSKVTKGEYGYDALGRRTHKTVDGTTTWFLYTDQGLAAEYDNNGDLIKEYHYSAYTQWSTNPLLQTTNGSDFYYYQNNHLGTPERLFDKTGAVVWQAQYDAFGWADIEVEDVSNNLRQPGQYYDSETGLYQNYFRDYDPALGRYLQVDPLGQGGGLNVYVYAFGNPLYYTDPTGELALSAAGAIAGAISGAISGGYSGGWKGALTGAAIGAVTGAISPASTLGKVAMAGVELALGTGGPGQRIGGLAGGKLAGSVVKNPNTLGGAVKKGVLGGGGGIVGGTAGCVFVDGGR